eukprot:COSAG06_NODE_128_length_22642_cov_195.891452_19_plen_103_part_00
MARGASRGLAGRERPARGRLPTPRSEPAGVHAWLACSCRLPRLPRLPEPQTANLQMTDLIRPKKTQYPRTQVSTWVRSTPLRKMVACDNCEPHESAHQVHRN